MLEDFEISLWLVPVLLHKSNAVPGEQSSMFTVFAKPYTVYEAGYVMQIT